MLRPKSKEKIRNGSLRAKKSTQNRQNKQNINTKKHQGKQNGISSLRLTQTLGMSKKQNKIQTQLQSSRKVKKAVSGTQQSSKNQIKKLEDEKFIQSLFANDESKNKVFSKDNKNCFVQKLISQIVPYKDSKGLSITKNSDQKIHDLQAELQMKDCEVRTLKQEIEELKMYVSNFTFKVFDLTVLCRKAIQFIMMQSEKILLKNKSNQVVSYIESLVRQWGLQQKIKCHINNTFKKLNSLEEVNKNASKKKCHTQSLKIPLQDYLQSLQNKQFEQKKQKTNFSLSQIRKLREIQVKQTNHIKILESCQNPCLNYEQESQEIMKIVSRRNSQSRRQQQQTYVAVKSYKAANGHQLNLNSGERVTILNKGKDRWLGLKDGIVGYFPKNILSF